MVAVTQSSFTFPLLALTTVAARGDLAVLQRMLSSQDMLYFAPQLFRAAAEARQLEVCDWLAKSMASLDCILSLDANLPGIRLCSCSSDPFFNVIPFHLNTGLFVNSMK
jgi:hypothetical protein